MTPDRWSDPVHPGSLVGDGCPFVSPYTWLSWTNTAMSGLRRILWTKWFPPSP